MKENEGFVNTELITPSVFIPSCTMFVIGKSFECWNYNCDQKITHIKIHDTRNSAKFTCPKCGMEYSAILKKGATGFDGT